MPLLDLTEKLTGLLGEHKGVWAGIVAILGGASFKLVDRLLKFKEKRLDDSSVRYEKEILRLTTLYDQLLGERRKEFDLEKGESDTWEAKYHALWEKWAAEWKDHAQAEGQILILTDRLEQAKQIIEALRHQTK